MGLLKQLLPPLRKQKGWDQRVPHAQSPRGYPAPPRKSHLAVHLVLQGLKGHTQQVQPATPSPPNIKGRVL